MTRMWSSDGGIHEIPITAAGRLWLCGKHVVGPDAEGLLRHLGASGVVCLTQRHELAERYADYVAWLDQHCGTARATWLPIPDLHAPSLDVAQPFVASLVERLTSGEELVMHCAAGIGRTGTIAAAILIGQGRSVDDAVAHVREHRPMAGPEVGPQLDLLRELHRAMSTGRG